MGADRVTNGPPSTTGVNQYDSEAIVLDQVNGTLYVSGKSRNLHALRKAQVVIQQQAALTTITTAQNLISSSLNAGSPNVKGRTVVIRGKLIYTSPGTTAPVLSLALVLGGVTLCTVTLPAISTTASTNMPVEFEFTYVVATTGTGATITSSGEVIANISANTPAAAASVYLDTNTAVSAAVNLTVANTLLVTIASTLTLTSAQLLYATIELVA